MQKNDGNHGIALDCAAYFVANYPVHIFTYELQLYRAAPPVLQCPKVSTLGQRDAAGLELLRSKTTSSARVSAQALMYVVMIHGWHDPSSKWHPYLRLLLNFMLEMFSDFCPSICCFLFAHNPCRDHDGYNKFLSCMLQIIASQLSHQVPTLCQANKAI